LVRGSEQEREALGALLRRLVEEGRVLVKAELALFRTDFYRRIARARIGALLLLVGAIMGQAAAVTFLVTLSFVLQPWIGRLGGSAVSVALGLGISVWAIRIGVRKLIAVVEDYEDEENGNSDQAATQLDQLFDRMRQRSREARDQLAETVGVTQARLHPQALIADLADEVVDHLQRMSHNMAESVRRRPTKAVAAAVILLLVVVRPPIIRITRGLGRATRQAATSFTRKQAGRPAASHDEESSA
jgi:hypothetical protein